MKLNRQENPDLDTHNCSIRIAALLLLCALLTRTFSPFAVLYVTYHMPEPTLLYVLGMLRRVCETICHQLNPTSDPRATKRKAMQQQQQQSIRSDLLHFWHYTRTHVISSACY